MQLSQHSRAGVRLLQHGTEAALTPCTAQHQLLKYFHHVMMLWNVTDNVLKPSELHGEPDVYCESACKISISVLAEPNCMQARL